MTPLLDQHDIAVVTLSKDTVELTRAHRERDGLRHTMLADPDLAVLRQFGLVHQSTPEFYSFTLAGIPLGFPVGFRSMAIPTTLLVDGDGIVRWIDQAEDYRLRGDEARIREALTHLP